jgi:hypothetical protein
MLRTEVYVKLSASQDLEVYITNEHFYAVMEGKQSHGREAGEKRRQCVFRKKESRFGRNGGGFPPLGCQTCI